MQSHNFCHTYIDNYFPKSSKRFQAIPKHANQSKTGSRKFLQKTILVLFYIEESNKNYQLNKYQ